jgi:FtsX extracellular domain
VIRRSVAVAMTALAVLSAAACSGGSSAPTSRPRTPPDLAGFLKLPVATPTACPADANGTTVGRRSPWVGHVDVSVYLDEHAKPAVVRRVGVDLRRLAGVRTVYSESHRQAVAEFQRLYTCSADFPQDTIPASYRLVLGDLTHIDRDGLLRRIVRMPGVGEVSCDPSDPCTNISRTGG